MIDEEETFRRFRYVSTDLTVRSSKKIVAVCDRCGKVRELEKSHYCDLCKSCSHIGAHPSEDARKKMSESRKGEKNHNYGKPLSAETRKKISESHKGKPIPEEIRKKMSESHKNIGLSKEHRKKISEGNKNRIVSEESRRKTSATLQRIAYDEWEEFASNRVYCPLFNETCRESNRDKYSRRCFICGLPEDENITKNGNRWRLSVHHVDMDKNQGCDGIRWKLIPVCMHCHIMLHTDLWIARIKYLLNDIVCLKDDNDDA